ncbi:MAG: hypothetical protein EOP34_06570 [Rickettsiales bacterium]|nr:MAG: hypothetical protein EOP34_06570 [Rickettsiales bacterium]
MINYKNNDEDYRIINRFKPVRFYNNSNDELKNIGIFVDVETTGSYSRGSKIIELALVPFEYTNDGKIYKILKSYVEFQDPHVLIPESITKLTGITNEMVKGKSFDTKKITDLVNSASVIIAHHAGFDKKFIEDIFPIFRKKTWGCTVKHINWRNENISSAKLEYLAYKYNVFYEAHRAEIDSLIGIHILAQKLPISGRYALEVLLENINNIYYKIWAEDIPFHKKDILKDRGYRWNNGSNKKPKSWYKIIESKYKEDEIKFLYNNIYEKIIDLKIDKVETI